MQSPVAFDRKLMTNDSSSMNGIFNWNQHQTNSGGRTANGSIRSMTRNSGFIDINEIPPAGVRSLRQQ